MGLHLLFTAFGCLVDQQVDCDVAERRFQEYRHGRRGLRDAQVFVAARRKGRGAWKLWPAGAGLLVFPGDLRHTAGTYFPVPS